MSLEKHSDFLLPTDDCRLLLLLEATGSVRKTAQSLGRDVSVVSRRIARLAADTTFLEKIDGQWRVSETGRKMNAWTQDAMLSQRNVLRERTLLRIATTREFAARVLSPGLPDWFGVAGDPGALTPDRVQLSIQVSESGVESLLLTGAADLGIDCGRPRDPLIRFERAIVEPLAVIASPELLRRSKPASMKSLLGLPHLHYSRLNTAATLGLSAEIPNVLATFNDLAAVRSACRAGLGWAVVPRYTVIEELGRSELMEIRGAWVPAIEPERFGVWWPRSREAVLPWVRRTLNWLKTREL